ncbi:peptidase MA family metallohydrolase [Actinokineospora sp. HUAS TT18]|uniref:peptidase MA family metallohydrolase n=1 Tax=Actinokineospora sp. HUAS TT18 TaxID=3447451 RepID=UPI003F5283B7
MASRGRVRAWLSAAVAVIALSAMALIALPSSQVVPPRAPSQGQPLGGVEPAAPAGTDPDRTDAVTTLLARRADSILRRDEAGFLGGIDPQADPAFVESQRALFANLAGVPFDHWSYTLHPDDSLDVSGLAGGAELWAPAVDLRYALGGIDTAPTSRAMGYLFVNRDGVWYLRSDAELAEIGRRTWRGPWDFGPCLVTTTARGLVLAHPGSQPMVDRLVRELDPAVEAVSQVWGGEWTGRVALLLPDGAAEMKALVGPDFPVESVVAVATADRVDTAKRAATGQRVILSPMGSRALSIASLRVVLRHEITHVAARSVTVDGSPMWLLEGFSDYVGYLDSGISLAQGAPDLARQVIDSGPPTALPEDRAFRGKDKELDLAYQQAWSIARFVADRYGQARLVTLYRELGGAGPMSAGDTDDLLRRVLDLDRAGLLREWRTYLIETLG